VLIPILVFVFFRIHFHYRDVAALLSLAGRNPKRMVGNVSSLLLVEDVHAGTLRMVDYAKSLGIPWKAVHVGINPDKDAVVREKWDKRVGEGELVFLDSPYRLLTQPIRQYVEDELAKNPNAYINVILGHLAPDQPWQQALHQNSAIIFELALQDMERVVVTNVPYQIKSFAHTELEGNGHGDHPKPHSH
jgi:hypothetical protein